MKYNKFFKFLSFFGTPYFYIILFLILIFFNSPLTIKLVTGILITEAICWMIKIIYKKQRPKPRKIKNFYQKLDANSFPSIHTARIALIVATTNILFFDYLLFLLSISLLIGVGFSRIYLKEHYLIDVITGGIIGLIIGSIIGGLI